MTLISKRVVLHFPGFEPLDGRAHRARYERSAKQSAAVWNFTVLSGDPEYGPGSTRFKVKTIADGWETNSHIHVFDHNALVKKLKTGSQAKQILAGLWSALQVIAYGGMAGYFRHAWRFGLFFIFPFLMMILGISLGATIAVIPIALELPALHLLWSVTLALCFFVFAFLPFAERFYTLHLFADWRMAVALARMSDAVFNRWLDHCAMAAATALSEPADEYVISSHSMGSSVAVHVIGILLERHPDIFAGKKVIFATLGSAILQCALLRHARVLRSRLGLVARCESVNWLDVQCLTDAIHFYKVPLVAVCGHGDARPAKMIFIRVKQTLTVEHYRKIKKDFLRVHRQYVLGPDLQAPFDFTLLTAGPRSGMVFAEGGYSKIPGL